MTPSGEKVSFPGSQGGLLAARLDCPADTPLAYALFAHCFTCSKDGFAAARISRTLAERSIADRIRRAIVLEGPLDPEQRARLLEIAERCPVHRTLRSETQVITRIVTGGEDA